MKKFFIRLSFFSLFSLVVYPLFLFIWGSTFLDNLKSNLSYKKTGGFSYTRLNEAKEQKDTDLLFLGSSHAYRGFDTRVFKKYGYNSFNLGSSAQTPIQTEILAERYIERIHPAVIIYEVTPRTFDADGIESFCDILSNDYLDKDILLLSLEQKNIKIFNTVIYALLKNMVIDRNSFFENPVHKFDQYIRGGYVQTSRPDYQVHKLEKRELRYKEEQKEAFIRTLNFIKEKNIPFILVSAPITKNQYDAHLNINEFYSWVSRYGICLNFNKILDLDDETHFYDAHHMNQSGVEIFNNKLAMILREGKIDSLVLPGEFSLKLNSSDSKAD